MRGLIDDVIQSYPDESEELDREFPPEGMREAYRNRAIYPPRDRTKQRKQPPSINVSVTVPVSNTNQNNNQQDQAMTESSNINQFNDAVTAGAIGNNNQVSDNTFTQINNANTAELLQLITKLKETATNFPAETQDAILIDLEDIETEIQKPEATRNPKKLKQRLTAILITAGAAASGVAKVTDFTNTAIDLGSKLSIELPTPGKP
ncbi:MAG: hypothetical protein MUC48_17190 [Leptolyngbya sp. Prado105]|nr:hypothetical protein [Leptolyngbya sp. Prado105]